ncbi:endonuclease/exonuclease/phosphatase family protein [Nocardioides humilatus]|uniref:Endonuclease/exonuclease/phosphatase family protein n=1 Tax=Nocardioides humilatus TaxID=2607660 RepID=A0A5B1LEW4_9ACTN|nr:endonuclease/exonuclease/phosphatase family protein [Nocardioides humilatus]KAA1419195.1 endonuclease/exonuclease/phosphatase family protein [Nocardioides humilatus]
MAAHHTRERMAPGQSWSAVYAPALDPLPDPHPTSALALVAGVRVCATVLPWRGCADWYPYVRSGQGKTEYAVDAVVAAGPTIWGGDWNTSFAPGGYAESKSSRARVQSAVDRLLLTVATEQSLSQADDDCSIDHVAVPQAWHIHAVARVRSGRLSDHDAYVVEAMPRAL